MSNGYNGNGIDAQGGNAMSDAHPDIIVGLDIGTSKVCAIVARRDTENPQVVHVLGVGHSPSDGLNRGVVVNIEKTVRSIETAVQGAESQSGVTIKKVVV